MSKLSSYDFWSIDRSLERPLTPLQATRAPTPRYQRLIRAAKLRLMNGAYENKQLGAAIAEVHELERLLGTTQDQPALVYAWRIALVERQAFDDLRSAGMQVPADWRPLERPVLEHARATLLVYIARVWQTPAERSETLAATPAALQCAQLRWEVIESPVERLAARVTPDYASWLEGQLASPGSCRVASYQGYAQRWRGGLGLKEAAEFVKLPWLFRWLVVSYLAVDGRARADLCAVMVIGDVGGLSRSGR